MGRYTSVQLLYFTFYPFAYSLFVTFHWQSLQAVTVVLVSAADLASPAVMVRLNCLFPYLCKLLRVLYKYLSVYNAYFTPPTPTRQDKTVLSCQYRRCEIGLRGRTENWLEADEGGECEDEADNANDAAAVRYQRQTEAVCVWYLHNQHSLIFPYNYLSK